jgi:hypothetical protein
MDVTGADLHAGSFGVACGFDVVFENVIPDCVGILPGPHVTSVPPITARAKVQANSREGTSVTRVPPSRLSHAQAGPGHPETCSRRPCSAGTATRERDRRPPGRSEPGGARRTRPGRSHSVRPDRPAAGRIPPGRRGAPVLGYSGSCAIYLYNVQWSRRAPPSSPTGGGIPASGAGNVFFLANSGLKSGVLCILHVVCFQRSTAGGRCKT